MRTFELFYCIPCIVISFGCASAKTDTRSPVEIYVSPTGSNQADGRNPMIDTDRLHGPFTTLNRARDELRRLRKKGQLLNGATINISEGTYELSVTFLLEKKDSGTPDAPIKLLAYRNEIVTLSGGLHLSNCNTNSTKLVTCEMSSLGLETLSAIGLVNRLQTAPGPHYEVFVNEYRHQLTRWPNSDRSEPGGDTWLIYHQLTNVPTKILNIVDHQLDSLICQILQ